MRLARASWEHRPLHDPGYKQYRARVAAEHLAIARSTVSETAARLAREHMVLFRDRVLAFRSESRAMDIAITWLRPRGRCAARAGPPAGRFCLIA